MNTTVNLYSIHQQIMNVKTTCEIQNNTIILNLIVCVIEQGHIIYRIYKQNEYYKQFWKANENIKITPKISVFRSETMKHMGE